MCSTLQHSEIRLTRQDAVDLRAMCVDQEVSQWSKFYYDPEFSKLTQVRGFALFGRNCNNRTAPESRVSTTEVASDRECVDQGRDVDLCEVELTEIPLNLITHQTRIS